MTPYPKKVTNRSFVFTIYIRDNMGRKDIAYDFTRTKTPIDLFLSLIREELLESERDSFGILWD